MFDRQWLGDLALAILLVLPLTGLASFTPAASQPAGKTAVTMATANPATNHAPAGRISLLG